jgi:hypothetical protein
LPADFELPIFSSPLFSQLHFLSWLIAAISRRRFSLATPLNI